MTAHGVRLEERNGSLVMVSNRTCCTRCILPDTFPDVDLRDGVCGICRSWDERGELDDGEALFKAAAVQAPADSPDVLVLYSGGKDSTLALARLAKDPERRPLAMTMDNGFLPQKTVANIERVCSSLGVEHVFIRPDRVRLRHLYKSATQRPLGPETLRYSTSACGVCISTVLAHALDVAHAQTIPTLAGGWTPGQFTWSSLLDGAFIERVVATNLDVMRERQLSLDGVVPDIGTPSSRPLLFNPLAHRPPTNAELEECLAQLGWVRPADLDSCSSNCQLNALLVVDHIERHGFHPYVYELAHHVRIGLLDREVAQAQLVNTGVSAAAVARLRRQLFDR